jgi:DNA-binding CsgD family transcriptional regulator
VASAQDRLAVGLSDLSLTLWSERRPSAALERLARLRTELPGEYADELDSAQALVTLFSGRPAQALALADRVLAQHVRRSAFIRATTTRLAALVVDDRPEEALAAGRRVTACLDAGTTSPYQGGLADAVIGTARLFGEPDAALPPALGSFGRWPVLAAADGQALGPAWPLLEGVRRHLAGDWPAAVVALREAFVQQQAGEGLFRSEAAGGLIVVLAECGRVAEAARLLAEHPPDGVALIPGMREWAAAAVAAASPAGGAAALEAARLALDAGALTTAMWYLADAARYGAARQAAELLDGLPARSELSRVRAAGIRARATRRPAALAGAAREHLRLGLFGHAAELADLAGNHEGATELVAEAQARLGRADRDGSPLARLTGREREVARLAAGGLTDREIADSLVVSVRTVESHLSSAYRKLGIRSRRALRESAGAHRDG